MSDDDAIRGVIEAWAASVRARDIDGVLRHHSDDILLFDVNGPIETRGIDAYRAPWVEQFIPWHGEDGRFDLSDLRISVGDSVAFATGLIHCAGIEDGAPVAFTLRLTIGLEKIGGQWTIVHEHHSEPLGFDTDRIGEGRSG